MVLLLAFQVRGASYIKERRIRAALSLDVFNGRPACTDVFGTKVDRHGASIHLRSFDMLIEQLGFSSARSEPGNAVRIDDESIKWSVASRRWRNSKACPRGDHTPVRIWGRANRELNQDDNLLGVGWCIWSYRAALWPNRSSLFLAYVLDRVPCTFLQEEGPYPRWDHRLRYVGSLTLNEIRNNDD